MIDKTQSNLRFSNWILFCAQNSVADPEPGPVGSETFNRIGSEMNLKLNYSEKSDKIDNFSPDMLNYKI
jgi:hypothetical protein